MPKSETTLWSSLFGGPELDFKKPFGPSKRRPYSQTAKEFGQFLKAIAEINSANPNIVHNDRIATILRTNSRYKAYANASQRQLRRKVGAALAWQIQFLEVLPAYRWKEIFGIEAPPEINKRSLRNKAFEALRVALVRHKQRQSQ